MKKVLLALSITLIVGSLISNSAFAGDKEMASLLAFKGTSSGSDKTNAIKINILSPVVKTFSVFFEHGMNEKSSIQLGFFYTGFKISDTKFSGFGITPEYRFHPSGDGLAGFYVAPFIRYQNFNLTSESETEVYDSNTGYYSLVTTTDKATLSSFGGGVLAGYQWLFGDVVSLDLFLGPMYNSGTVKVTEGADNFSTGGFDGFTLRAGVTLGVAF
jgi:hypothetical protein